MQNYMFTMENRGNYNRNWHGPNSTNNNLFRHSCAPHFQHRTGIAMAAQPLPQHRAGIAIASEPGPQHRMGIAILEPPAQPWSTLADEQPSYSSRNSFRSFGTYSDNVTVSQGYRGAMTEYPFDIGFDERANYERLISSECFLRVIGDFYYCTLCGRRARLQNELTVPKHLESQVHSERYIKLKSDLCDMTPSDNSLQMNGINKLTTRWLSNSLSEQDEMVRYSIIKEFEEIVKMVDPQCSCRVLGSLRTQTALHDSDINIELMHPNSEIFESDPRAKTSIHHQLIDPDAEFGSQINMHTLHYDLIPNAVETMHKIANIIEQGFIPSAFIRESDISDLNSKIPKLGLRHQIHDCILEVVCYSNSSFRLTELLRNYLTLDERARELSIIVKNWAKICKISNPDAGSYPPEAYVILVIYYLQRTSPPVLPCLHDMYAKVTKNARTDSNEKQETNGFNDEERPTEQEDEDGEDEDSSSCNLALDEQNLTMPEWSSENTRATHVLFIDFLQTMAKEFDNLDNVISIKTLRPISLKSKPWKTMLKAIENPIKPRNNISMSIGTQRTFSYIKQCFRQSYYYLTSVPLTPSLVACKIQYSNPEDFIQLYVNPERLNFYFSMKESLMKNKLTNDTVTEMIGQNIFARDVEVIRKLLAETGRDSRKISHIPSAIANGYRDALLAPRNNLATSYCWLCRTNGHDKKSCVQGIIEDLKHEKEDYNVNLDHIADLDPFLLNAYHRDIIGPELAKKHKDVVKELSQTIREDAGIDCLLELYGSTVNHLGNYDSDLDICMTIAGDQTGRNVDCVVILRKVHDILVGHPQVRDLEPRFSARVPILKFVFKGFDIDLSMYNQCAIYNSRLLKKYSTLDERVAPLIYLVKRFAKACQIADASRGSLSSYAWSLMVIHYLQNISPPILPVLQEPEKGTNPKLIGVNGWNVWFRKDVTSNGEHRNTFTLTQLFKGFFLYYANFDFNEKVIAIRMKGSLSKFRKNWHNCMMAIEDPFELTYNLASRLDNPMAIYIINSFAKAFRHIIELQGDYASAPGSYTNSVLLSKLFDGQAITRSTPPFRGCRICHRIGHPAKDCPESAKTSTSRPRSSPRKPPENNRRQEKPQQYN